MIQKNIPEIDKVEVLGNYSPSKHESSRIVSSSSSSYPTFKENHGTIPAVAIEESKLVGGFGSKGSTNQYRTQNRVYSSSSSSPTLSTAFNPSYETGLGIRRLTERDCFRLMGLKDEDIDLILEHQTTASAYHLAGDSIVTTCLMAILGQFIDVDYKQKFIPEDWWKE